jgi:hypothetical protein
MSGRFILSLRNFARDSFGGNARTFSKISNIYHPAIDERE